MPDENNSGGTVPNPAPPPPAVPVPNPTSPSSPPPPTPTSGSAYIQLSAEEYRALLLDRQAAETHRLEEMARADAERALKAKALADKEGIEAALKMVREQHEAREKEYQEQAKSAKAQLLEYRKTNSLNLATAGIDWVSPEAASDATAKLAQQFEAVEVGGQVVVRQVGTGRSASEAIPELLKSPAYQHYLRASTHGGSAMGSNRSEGEVPPGWVAPQNEGQAAYATWLAQKSKLQEQGYAGIGLGFGPAFDPNVSANPTQGAKTPSKPYFQ